MLRILERIKLSWPVLVLTVFYGYLAFHSLSGSLGVLKWADYAEQSDALTSEISFLRDKREGMELRASQLRANNLDLDRLDEEARNSLNVSYPNEIVIWLDETP